MMVVSARLLMTMALAIAVIFNVLGRSFIDLWIGPGYSDKVEPVLILLSIAFVADSASGGMRAMLTGIDRVDFVTKLNWVAALVTVLFGVVLVYFFGVIGMAWALLASSVVVNVVICPYLTCRLYEFSWLRYLREVLLRPAVAAVPGVIVALTLTSRFHPTRLLEWLPLAGAVGVTVVATAF
jgi:O-antigen/teichoic acid export membrane protein